MILSNFKSYLESKGHSSSTIKGHEQAILRLEVWAEKELLELEMLTYQDLLNYTQTLSEAGKGTIAKYLITFRHYYDYLMETGKVVTNPVLHIKLQGTRKKAAYNILTPLELESIYHKFITAPSKGNHPLKVEEHQMNTVMLGLLVYQGLSSQELIALKPEDVQVRAGQIEVLGGRKSNRRLLKLEAVQILEMQEYLTKTRGEILAATGKASEQLFVSLGSSDKLHHTIQKFTRTLKAQSNIENLQQLRASVIVKWLNTYNLRQTQYMAGHRFVSSTEKYKQNDLRDLQEDINKFHPIN